MALPYQQFRLLYRSPILVRGAFQLDHHQIGQRKGNEKISRTMAPRTWPTASVKVLRVFRCSEHYAVLLRGDDRQAIYGFAGRDVDHIVNFESHFGPASQIMLDTNYRSPAIIVEAG